MKKGLQNILLSATAALVLAACNFGFGQSSAVEDTQIGLRNVSLEDELNVKNPAIAWKGDSPGSNELFERSYENAPPLIPHSLDGLLPITIDGRYLPSSYLTQLTTSSFFCIKVKGLI